MHQRKIIFRADGNPAIGMGHFIRTLALAGMLKDDFYCVFATQSATPYQISEIGKICSERIDLPVNGTHFEVFLNHLKGDEIVVLDNYFFTTEYQREIKDKGCKLVCIDDMHNKHFIADIVINHAPITASEYSATAYTKLLLGFNYALLRQDFFKSGATYKKFSSHHVLVCFGGADFNNLTIQTLKSIDEIECINTITVIIGNAFCNIAELERVKNEIAKRKSISIFHNLSAPELVERIREADFAIVPCSTVLYEVLSQQKPVITGFYVDNQIEINKNIKDKYAHILVIGDLNEIRVEKLHIEQLRNQVSHSRTTSLINNKTSSLIQNEFHYLNNEFSITVRKANNDDVNIYFNWANDQSVRKNAINNDPILYQDHCNWFQNKINQANSALFVFEENHKPVGQVRFDKENETLVIDYSIDIGSRGKGLGKVIMKMGIEKLYSDELIKTSKFLIAKVRESNIASSRVFESLNFDLETTESVGDNNFFIFKKEIK